MIGLRRTMAFAHVRSAVLALCLCIGPAVDAFAETDGAPRGTEAPAARALWVWSSTDVRHDASARRTFFAFLAAPHARIDRAIRTLFLDGISVADLSDGPSQEEVRSLLTDAHHQHIRVDYLTGDASWALSANHQTALDILRTVLSYNRSVPPVARFDGFQLDVEPYGLKGWPSEEIRVDYLKLLASCRDTIQTSNQKLLLGAAIPRWFDQEKLDHLDRKVIDRTDYIAIMDYVDSGDRLIADATDEIAYAAKVHKLTWIGVETQRLPDEPGATFFGKGMTAMEDAFEQTARHFRGNRGFAGFAIHHRDSYAAMAR